MEQEIELNEHNIQEFEPVHSGICLLLFELY